MSPVGRGKLSVFTHESKFKDNINTKTLAQMACLEGDILRDQLSGHRVLHCPPQNSPFHNWDLANSFRL